MDARVSQAARDDAAEWLAASWTAGAMSLETFESRVSTVLGAARQSELDGALADLPGGRRSLRPGADGDRLVLGRSRSCSHVFRDDAISRRHALVYRARSGEWRVTDLDSTNGTWLNGHRVRRSAPLADGDEIRVGRLRLTWLS